MRVEVKRYDKGTMQLVDEVLEHPAADELEVTGDGKLLLFAKEGIHSGIVAGVSDYESFKVTGK